jgi:predicted RND superfamily exporter protein
LLSQTLGRGVLVASLTTILGFGTLMISTHRGLASLGLILALGVACCTAAALVLLPAVLRLIDRPLLAAQRTQPALEPPRSLVA